MKLHPRVEQVSVEMLKGVYVELYILRGDMIVLIDTGIVPSPERDILPVLKSLGLTLSDVDLILDTHAHPDHVEEMRMLSQSAVPRCAFTGRKKYF